MPMELVVDLVEVPRSPVVNVVEVVAWCVPTPFLSCLSFPPPWLVRYPFLGSAASRAGIAENVMDWCDQAVLLRLACNNGSVSQPGSTASLTHLAVVGNSQVI